MLIISQDKLNLLTYNNQMSFIFEYNTDDRDDTYGRIEVRYNGESPTYMGSYYEEHAMTVLQHIVESILANDSIFYMPQDGENNFNNNNNAFRM